MKTRRVSTNERARRVVAVIGAGFSGVAVATRLLQSRSAGPLQVVLIDRPASFGRGVAYSARSWHSLLNVPASNMSLEEEAPDDFVDYARTRGYRDARAAYLPRALYGDYLEDRLQRAVHQAATGKQLLRRYGSVVDLARRADDRGWQLTLDNATHIEADRVVLALGHAPPATPREIARLVGTPWYAPDPWSLRAHCSAPRRVLLVGSGLTAVDAAWELSQRAFPPREIVMISRHGLLPREQAAQRDLPRALARQLTSDLLAATTLRLVVRTTRDAIRHADRLGIDWRAVITALRDVVPLVWRNLADRERARFLRHVRPHWDAARHRLPAPVAAEMQELIRDGRVRVVAGRIISTVLGPDGVTIGIRARGTTQISFWDFDQVINCTGPGAIRERHSEPLIRRALAAGILTTDAQELGISLDDDGRPVDAAGAVTRGLFYLGPWQRARDWEGTAVRELRRSAARISESILTEFALGGRGWVGGRHLVPLQDAAV